MRIKNLSLSLGVFTLLTFVASTYAEHHPLDPKNDHARMPEPGSSPLFWQGDEQVAGFRNMHKLQPARKISAGERTLELPSKVINLDNVSFGLDGQHMTTREYIDTRRVGGLIVIKDGNIVYEKYGLGNNQQTRWVSFSVAKSVVSMLIGAAIKDGYIKSLDEKVTDYLPRLKGSSYDQSTIRNLLQMASGVTWNEDYEDPESDIASVNFATLELYNQLRNKPREAKPGDKFNYNTAETNLAGTLLRSAIGNNLATYLTDKIWVPFGMEADASWQLTEPGGGEFGGCCINATLRDYARLGLFALNNGRLADGTEVLPPGWMAESVAPSKGSEGYGYFWWLKGDGVYEASGIFGQGIYIDPTENLVIAIQSARESADKRSDWDLQDALMNALTSAVSDN